MTKLSYSAITTYTTCGHKYKLRYKDNLRGKYFHAALAFGSAIDLALNELLITKDLDKSYAAFDKAWAFQFVNKKYVSLSHFSDLVYAEADFDEELLKEEDLDSLNLEYIQPIKEFKYILALKKDKGWSNIAKEQKEFYNYVNWLSMRRKGHIMLSSYNKKILPRIKEVLVVQKENYLDNGAGDKIVQYLDLIATWEDGRNILFDNKTSAKDYEPDQASRSPQLISYYFGAKKEYNLKGVGFFVLKKQMIKNRVKVCEKCGYDGSGGRHKTCDQEAAGKRCNGAWKETISPECYIQIIISDVAPAAQELVLSTFDTANEGIKAGNFYKNLSACRSGYGPCEYEKVCWKNDFSDVVDLSETKNSEDLFKK